MTVWVLASGSPRRRELLQRFGVAFDVRPVPVDESTAPGEDPVDLVRRLAIDKAQAAAAAAPEPDLVVVAADTVVVLDDEVMGKPLDAADAGRMLTRLAGRTHRVLTGIAVIRRSPPGPASPQVPSPQVSSPQGAPEPGPHGQGPHGQGPHGQESGRGPGEVGSRGDGPAIGSAVAMAVDVEATEVTMVAAGAAEIGWYVGTGEPLDKAGAYGIQGRGGILVSSIRGSWDNVVGLPLATTRRLLAEVGIDPLAHPT